MWSLVFNGMEDPPAPLLAALSVSIKVYGDSRILLFLFDRRWLKSLLASGAWCMLIAATTLLVVSPAQLQFLYESWGVCFQRITMPQRASRSWVCLLPG